MSDAVWATLLVSLLLSLGVLFPEAAQAALDPRRLAGPLALPIQQPGSARPLSTPASIAARHLSAAKSLSQAPVQLNNDASPCPNVGGLPWGVSAAQAGPIGTTDPLGLRRSYPDRVAVLVCIIAPGGITNTPLYKNITLNGCKPVDGVDPGGCVLPWDRVDPKSSQHGWPNQAAAIIAAPPGNNLGLLGVFPGVSELYVVPTINAQGSIEAGTSDPTNTSSRSLRSRLRAYTACEGRLRSRVAQTLGQLTWRMVILPLITDPTPIRPIKQNLSAVEADVLYPSEGEWMNFATTHSSKDVVVVAPAVPNDPAASQQAKSYPAALPPVLGVVPVDCSNQLLRSYPRSALEGTVVAGPGRAVATQSSSSSKVLADGSYPAAALVAGVAARLWQSYPMCSNTEVLSALETTGAQVKGTPSLRLVSLKAAAEKLEKSPCSKVEPTAPIRERGFFQYMGR